MQRILLFFLILSALTLSGQANTQLSAFAPEPEVAQSELADDNDGEEQTFSTVSCEIEEGQILFDDQGVVIKTMSFEVDEYFGPAIWLSVDNHNDKALQVYSGEICINGLMIPDGAFICDVAANATSTGFFSCVENSFADYGIETIADIQVVFELCDAESFESYFITDMIEIKTAATGTFQQPIDASGVVVYENDDFKVILQGVDAKEGYNPEIKIYLENNFDKYVSISTSDFSFNDGESQYMPIYWLYMFPHTKAFDTIELQTGELKGIGVDKIENMSFSIEVLEPDTYDHYLDIPVYIDMSDLTAQPEASGSL